MKIILILSLMAICFTARSQDQPADSLFIVTYTTGSGWDVSKGPHEQVYFKEHSSNLSAMRKAGTIKFGARYADKGIIVITAASLKKAKEMIEADPAVAGNLFSADVQKLNPFYEGCVEKPKPSN